MYFVFNGELIVLSAKAGRKRENPARRGKGSFSVRGAKESYPSVAIERSRDGRMWGMTVINYCLWYRRCVHTHLLGELRDNLAPQKAAKEFLRFTGPLCDSLSPNGCSHARRLMAGRKVWLEKSKIADDPAFRLFFAGLFRLLGILSRDTRAECSWVKADRRIHRRVFFVSAIPTQSIISQLHKEV